MAQNKEYLIRIMIKRMQLETPILNSINLLIGLSANTFHRVPPKDVDEIHSLYNLETFVSKMVQLIDSLFTEEEIKEVIRFYSSEIGKKLSDSDFLAKIQKINTDIGRGIEQEFAIRNARIHNTK